MSVKAGSSSRKPPAARSLSVKEAERRQRAYARSRREWAEAVGRPYVGDDDPRPPPGELDVGPDE